jgi:hypothetical protein
MKEKINRVLIESLPVILLSTLIIAVIIYAWTEPSQAPPQGNVPAPINVGATTQYKSGGLGVGGVLYTYSSAYASGQMYAGDWITSNKGFCIGSSCITQWPTGGGITGSGSANYIPIWTGATSLGNSVIYQSSSGYIGIGTTNPTSPLHVTGEIRSDYRLTLTARGALEQGSGSSDLRLMSVGNLEISPGGIVTVGKSVKISGRLGTSGYDPDSGYPSGWGGGIQTWDVYAHGGVRADKMLCIGSDCRTSWPAGGSPTTWDCTTVTDNWRAYCPSGYRLVSGGCMCGWRFMYRSYREDNSWVCWCRDIESNDIGGTAQAFCCR